MKWCEAPNVAVKTNNNAKMSAKATYLNERRVKMYPKNVSKKCFLEEVKTV